MQLSLSTAFLFLGFIQGVFLSYIAFFHKAMNHLSHKLLGLFIVILTLATLGTFANHELENPDNSIGQLIINYFPYYFVVIVGPAAYFHCRSILEKDFTFSLKDKLHFTPVLLEFVPFLGFLVLMIGVAVNKVEIPDNGIFKSLQWYQRAMELPRICSLIVYMYLTLSLLIKYKKDKKTYSYQWVKTMVFFGGGIIISFFIGLFIFFSPMYDAFWKKYMFEVYMIYYPVVGFIYLLTVKIIFRKAPWFLNSVDLTEIWDRVAATKDSLSDENQKILKVLNDFIFNHIDDSNLTIEMIAYELNASRSRAISLIKNLTDKTPLAYVKSIRMEYVSHLIKTEKVKNYSEAAKSIGMSNPTQFANQYKKHFGDTAF